MMERSALVLLLCVAAVSCVPVEKSNRQRRDFNDAVIVVDTPSRARGSNQTPFRRFPFDDSDGDDDDDWGFGVSFSDSFRRMQEQFRRMQEQMEEFMKNRFPSLSTGGFGDLPTNYHNSTSETKNVNGTLVTVNQTIDRHTSNNSQSFFHVQVVQVKPEKPVVPSDNPSENTETPLPVNPEEEDTTSSSTPPAEIAKKDEDRSNPSVEMNEP